MVSAKTADVGTDLGNCREEDRLRRIKEEGWDRFAPVTETNKKYAALLGPTVVNTMYTFANTILPMFLAKCERNLQCCGLQHVCG